MPPNRRTFILTVGAATLASTQVGPLLASTASANETLRFAVIGFGGRGKSLIDAINASPNATLVALADVDQKVLRKQSGDKSLFRTNDFRRILDRDDVDAIASATPNHWHSLLTILACQAGKHVYIEKPISHNMLESKAVVAAAARYDKLVQAGFQNRSDTGLIGFYEKLHAGDYGKVVSIHGTCHRARASIGKLEQPLKIPPNINYDIWLGPALDLPIMRPRLHYDWHWDFNTGNGDVGNQGPHEWDLMNWALGNPNDLPSQMVVAGNRFAWDDAGNTPNVLACAGLSNGIPISFEVMDLKPGGSPPDGRGVGVIIHTEGGRFIGGRGGGKFVAKDGAQERFSRDHTQAKHDGTRAHMQNFIDAVLANDRTRLRADCRVAANSSSMAHMANISYQLRESVSPAELESAFDATDDSRDMFARLTQSTEIFAKKHGVEVREPWLLGAPLRYDNAVGEFVGPQAQAANDKMTRDYRVGFELPKIA